MSIRTDRAAAVIRAFDPEFFALCAHPVRLQIIRRLLEQGGGGVNEIARGFTQDRSVISRHLSQMEQGGLLKAKREGRHVVYDLNGPELVRRLRALADAAALLSAHCCPTDSKKEAP